MSFCRIVGALVAALCVIASERAIACGADTDCKVDGGTYRIDVSGLPDGTPPAGAVMFFHGWQGTAAGVMRNRRMIDALARRGLAVIAPQGVGKSWSFPGSPSQDRDDFSFVAAVLSDAESRFEIPEGKTVASGFSLGGSMVWYLACQMSGSFAGFAPVAGAFWEPLPESCSDGDPVMVHIHGTSDRTVPMAGRPIGDHWHQGDVYRSFETLTAAADCPVPSVVPEDDGLTCKMVSPCGGRLVELCLHKGGHSLRSEWVVRAVDAIVNGNSMVAD